MKKLWKKGLEEVDSEGRESLSKDIEKAKTEFYGKFGQHYEDAGWPGDADRCRKIAGT